MKPRGVCIKTFLAIVLTVAFLSLPVISHAHCDTLSGPVVTTARAALERGDVTPVLKWIKKDDEARIKSLFKKTLAVRTKGAEAKELADMYFFETLVRLHRAGEGAPYTGLKPVGEVEPAVAAADKAIETGSVDGLIKMINDAASSGVRERFVQVNKTGKHADENVESGRKYVAAYVDFTHYVEKLHLDATGSEYHQQETKHKSTEDQNHQ